MLRMKVDKEVQVNLWIVALLQAMAPPVSEPAAARSPMIALSATGKPLLTTPQVALGAAAPGTPAQVRTAPVTPVPVPALPARVPVPSGFDLPEALTAIPAVPIPASTVPTPAAPPAPPAASAATAVLPSSTVPAVPTPASSAATAVSLSSTAPRKVVAPAPPVAVTAVGGSKIGTDFLLFHTCIYFVL
jgi:hypothetical protein